jgi:hypothetical protein
VPDGTGEGGTPSDRFRILSIDGGGIRGLISAKVIARLESLLTEEARGQRRITDCFHMLCGTSTGGLVALALAVPDPERPGRPRLSGDDLVRLYLEDGPLIFRRSLLRRLLTGWGWLGPKHSPASLAAALRQRLGQTRLREALCEVVVTSYDMHEPGPHFFKRWRARQSPDRDAEMVDAALATAAAPTFFPSHGLGERALVDGGVFAANPTVAGIAEALKRSGDDPAGLAPSDLLVVSVGTGEHQVRHDQGKIRRWGRIGWIWPRAGEAALLAAFLDGQSDAAHHWADILLNHDPGGAMPEPSQMGRGPRYFRFQTSLPPGFGLDDARPKTLRELSAFADRLVEERGPELEQLGRRLARLEPLPGSR